MNSIRGETGSPFIGEDSRPTTRPESWAIARKSLKKLAAYVEREAYSGYDPYDALLSPLARHPLFRLPAARIAFTQILRRLPVNVRPALRIPKEVNPKGLALFLSGYAMQAAAENSSAYTDRIQFLLRLLESRRSSGFRNSCWGYNFPWQNRNQLYPAFTPTLVNTGFAGHALLDVHDVTGDRRLQELAESAARFILEDLVKVVDDGSRMCLGYTPLDATRIFNSNAIGASFLARIGAIRHREDWLRDARKILNWVAEHQNPDGSWTYGDTSAQRWIDLHHTAFILESYGRYQTAAGDCGYREVVEKGTAFFLRVFFQEDGSASLWHDRPFPKDVHAFAAVSALCAIPQTDRVRRARRTLVRWLVNRMQSPDGYFYYQLHRGYRIRIPYMRWSQAWAFYGLSASLLSEADRGGNR
jgi:hypothetical protein